MSARRVNNYFAVYLKLFFRQVYGYSSGISEGALPFIFFLQAMKEIGG
jgi:hypothetical protein